MRLGPFVSLEGSGDELTPALAPLKKFIEESRYRLRVHGFREVMAKMDEAIDQLDVLADDAESRLRERSWYIG